MQQVLNIVNKHHTYESGWVNMKWINNLDESATIIHQHMINNLLGNVHGSHNVNVSMNKWAWNATGMMRWINSFYVTKAKYYKHWMNDEMKMKGGRECDANPNVLRVCWMFLTHIFLHQLRKQLSEIYASKPRRNLQTFDWCLQFK